MIKQFLIFFLLFGAIIIILSSVNKLPKPEGFKQGTTVLSDDEKIKVLFRIDDFGQDTTSFYNFIVSEFAKFNIPLNIGVIPFETIKGKQVGLNEIEVSLLKQWLSEKKITVGVHGFLHKDNEASNVISEFLGLSLDTQLNMVAKAKQYLDSVLEINVTTFIPPFNRYDSLTIKALEKSGYKSISPSLYGEMSLPYKSNLAFIPYTVTLSDFINQKDKILDEIDSSEDAVIIVLFHTYDFVETENYFNHNSKYKLKSHFNKVEFIQFLKEISEVENIQFETFDRVLQSEIYLTKNQYSKLIYKEPIIPFPKITYTNKIDFYTTKEYGENTMSVLFLSILPIFISILSFVLGAVLLYLIQIRTTIFNNKYINLVLFFTIVLVLLYGFIINSVSGLELQVLFFIMGIGVINIINLNNIIHEKQ